MSSKNKSEQLLPSKYYF